MLKTGLFPSVLWFICFTVSTCSAILRADEPPVTVIRFSPDGQLVITASQAGLRVLTWPSLEVVQHLELSLANVHDMSFSPDGKHLAVAGGLPAEVGIVELFDWMNRKSIQKFEDHEDCVMSVAWMDADKLVSASLDHDIVIRGLTQSSAVEVRLRGHSRGVTAICLIPEFDVLVSGSIDQNLRAWNLSSGHLIRSLNNHTGPIQQVALRPKVDAGLPMVASVSRDRTVRLWQPTIGRMVRFTRLPASPLDVAWSNDGEHILVSATDGHVYVIDPESAEVEARVRCLDGWAYSLAVHPTSDAFVVGGRNGQIKYLQLHDLAFGAD